MGAEGLAGFLTCGAAHEKITPLLDEKLFPIVDFKRIST
jgi:hypothetical protein